MTKIVSWNVAGLRAMIKKPVFHEFIALPANNFDIICLQETKAEESQVCLPEIYTQLFPYKFWNATHGTTQRKGLSGTSIWCRYPPIKVIGSPDFDQEGRIITLEFQDFVLVNVYVPNSQKLENDRYYFREDWNNKFMVYLQELQSIYIKPLIVCGDMNVAHNDIDISNPRSKKNKVPGFFDNERKAFGDLLMENSLVDVFRILNPTLKKSTYWSNFLKSPRDEENGWRIDYFLVSKNILKNLDLNTDIKIDIKMDIMGSDHCPIVFEFNINK